jgi:hypothetical protein
MLEIDSVTNKKLQTTPTHLINIIDPAFEGLDTIIIKNIVPVMFQT